MTTPISSLATYSLLGRSGPARQPALPRHHDLRHRVGLGRRPQGPRTRCSTATSTPAATSSTPPTATPAARASDHRRLPRARRGRRDRARARHEVHVHCATRRPERRRQQPQEHLPRARGLAAPPEDRLRRPVLAARVGRHDAGRGGDARRSTTSCAPARFATSASPTCPRGTSRARRRIAEQRGYERVAALQLEYSLVERNIEREHIPAALELGVGVTPWSPLASGLLTGKYTREGVKAAGAGRLDVVKDQGNPAFLKLFTERNWTIVDELIAVARELESAAGAGRARVGRAAAGRHVDDRRRDAARAARPRTSARSSSRFRRRSPRASRRSAVPSWFTRTCSSSPRCAGC